MQSITEKVVEPLFYADLVLNVEIKQKSIELEEDDDKLDEEKTLENCKFKK
jgi:hypothetical protein